MLRVSVLRHPLAVDIALALGFLACALLLGRQRPSEGYQPLTASGYALTVLVNLAVAARRLAPVVVTAVVCGLWAVYVAAGFWPVVNSLASLLALYTVAAERPLRAAVGCAAGVGGVWVYGGVVSPRGSMSAVVVQAVVFSAVMIRFGAAARESAARGERLAELAGQLRRERDEKARRAVVEEQTRIARELHDVTAHHVSVISLQAGLARYVLARDPDTARRALETIAATSGEALDEMRRMLTLLRAGGGAGGADGGGADGGGGAAPFAPVPGLRRLDEVLARVRAGGVPVELVVEGDVRPLPPGVELCAYRVVQEALTNVLKHARPASAEVRLTYRPYALELRVTDDGQGADPATVAPGTGHGLIGMRERAKLYGGAVTAARRPDGGFEVLLSLPTSGGQR